MSRVPVARGWIALRLLVPLLAGPLAGGAALSDARVVLDQGRVSIHSQSEPLAEVLSRFAQATGAQVVYEAARPSQLVTVVIEAASPAEAIARLLEGQGLNYALRLDPSGRNVEMLVVTGSRGAEAASAPAGPRRSFAPPLDVPTADADDALAGEPVGEDEPPFVPDAPELPLPTGAGEGGPPRMTAPPWSGDPGGVPGAVPETPGLSSPPAGQPQPPLPASYPASPAPARPVYPGPASYPPGE